MASGNQTKKSWKKSGKMGCRGKGRKKEKKTTENADRTSDGDNLLLPPASTQYSIQTFSGHRVGSGEERKQAGHSSHRAQVCNAKKARHGTPFSPSPLFHIHSYHISRNNKDRCMIFQHISHVPPVSLRDTELQTR